MSAERSSPEPHSDPPWRYAPQWLASLVVHLLLVAVVGGMVVQPPPAALPSDALQVRWSVESEGGADSASTAAPTVQAAAPPSASQPDPAPAIGPAGPRVADPDTAIDRAVTDSLRALDAAGAARPGTLGLRDAAGRRAATARHGGSGATESAVERGLAWLARHQQHDGSWDSDEYTACCRAELCVRAGEPRGFAGHDVPITALALLAFHGAGHDGRAGPHAQPVRRATRWLLGRQREDGAFCDPGPWPAKFTYHQALVLFALSEGYALTRDEALRAPLQRAIRQLERAQHDGGGWGYRPGPERADSSVTGWVALSLLAARSAGVPGTERALAGVVRYLREMSTADGRLRYTAEPDRADASVALAAVGLMLRLALGEDPGAPQPRRAIALLAAERPDRSRWAERDQCLYAWYHGSLALFMVGGEDWAQWNARLVPAVLGGQLSGGCADGCWPAESLWARQGGGRVYATALSVLCLEVYYRYVPELVRERGRTFAALWR